MEFISPTKGKLIFEEMFREIISFIQEDPKELYHLIVGTDSLPGEEVCFVTAVIIHRIGYGGRYFYRKITNNHMRSLRQRIFYEATLSLETAGLITSELSKNGVSELPIEIHIDIGTKGETKQLIKEVVGMITSSGYAAKIKPESFGASKVADKYSK
ncbi:MAG: ribonuclease H-like YkuK family protein [bacterium]